MNVPIIFNLFLLNTSTDITTILFCIVTRLSYVHTLLKSMCTYTANAYRHVRVHMRSTHVNTYIITLLSVTTMCIRNIHNIQLIYIQA